jgi:phosphonate transport system substrate-binding protein
MKVIRHFVVLLSALLFSTSTTANNITITFGVVPQQSAKKMVERWQPLIQHISEFSGLHIEFETAKDIPTFENNLANGRYDIAYMNPYHFVAFHDSVGYTALARQKNKAIKGIIVTHKDSDITSLEDLNGTEIAFPAPAAFAATIITQAELKKRNISFVPRYVKSHDSVYLAVEKGFFKSGGGILRTFNAVPGDINKALHVLWESNGYTPHAFATHPKMAQNHREAILKALIAISDDTSKSWVLDGLGFNGFIPSNDSDWNDVRALGIASLSRPQI